MFNVSPIGCSRTQASNLLIWMMASVRPVHLRMYVIEVLANEPKAKEIISTLIIMKDEVKYPQIRKYNFRNHFPNC